MSQSILVVDDDPDTLTLIGLTLQRRGFEVIKAQSGPEALSLLAHDTPDLIILDVMMPQMDGYEVCRQIKADPRIAHLPIMMLTAKAQTASQLEGFRAGAIDYVTKPVHPQDLITRIQSVLEHLGDETPPPGAQVISISGVKGGVGATTLAVNLALVMAAQTRTILVDLEPSGTCALHLGLTPKQGLHDLLNGEADSIDPARVEAALTSHVSGLRLLAAADSPVEPERAIAILNRLLILCDVCLVDLGWGANPLSRAIGQRSNNFVLAIDSDRVALTQTSRMLHILGEAGLPLDNLQLIWINRLGAPEDVAQAAIRAVLGRQPTITIGTASKELYHALEDGQPLVVSHPEIPAAAQMRALAESLLNPTAAR
jgi:DNA-binding response OmpR family regulator